MAISDLAYVDSAGFHAADYETVLTYLKTEYRAIYGQDVYLEPDSQDGQWIGILALAITDTIQLAESVYNSFSPATALGDALARNVRINGIRARAATYSTVDLTLAGTAGTVLSGAIAQDAAGQKWDVPDVTLPAGGTVVVTATAQTIGAVLAPAGSVTKIATPVRGWQSVTNAAAATPGAPVETDAELRARQAVSVAIPSQSIFVGTIGAVASVPGVTRWRGYENDTGVTDSNGIPGHTISLVVEGGDAAAIAQAIAVKKTPGTGTHGTTTVVVTDAYGAVIPIRFYRPTAASIQAVITIQALAGYTAGIGDKIAAAVAAAINALPIGEDVVLSRLYGPANLSGADGATFQIDSITLGRDGGAQAAANVAILFNEAAAADVADITVTVA